jgi:hypothetical protein
VSHGPDGVVESSQNEILEVAAQRVLFERFSSRGERYTEHRFADGFYRMADPKFGSAKHHTTNQLRISRGEISDYLNKGFHLRMRGEISGQVNLVAPSQIRAIAKHLLDGALSSSLCPDIDEPNNQKME